MRRKNYSRRPQINKERRCSCGGKSKLGSRRNYPFGRNSKPVRTNFCRCKSCGKVTILTKDNNGGQ